MNRTKSLGLLLVRPSAMFAGIEIAARRICETSPYLSVIGYARVSS